MDVENPVLRLCMEGSRLEFENRIEDARASYRQAWQTARSDFEKCVAAHYAARYQEDPTEELRWNLLAFEYAGTAPREQVEAFYPSLYLNLGRSYERVGDRQNSEYYFGLAAGLGAVHQPGPNERGTGAAG